jgi:asparagine synthase (glutamine-hydrolysing)
MSAICGIFRKRASPEQCGEAVNRMTDSMKRIGPDSLNIRNFGPVTLAHQALIVSPHEKTDTQPLYLPDENLSIVYDGRLYNRSEIYETLKDRPRPDAPDAHLLLKLYEQIGVDAFHKANGEFAVAIYDHRKNELLLARDPVGHRILYYADTPEFFAFASSTDALVTLPEIESGIDPLTLAYYFLYLLDLAQGRTLHKAIKSVASAHTLNVSKNQISTQRYYTFAKNRDSKRISIDDSIDGLRYQITRSVEDRIGRSATIGTCLSGGLDSSSVTAIAARFAQSQNQPIHSFSAMPTNPSDPLSLEEIEHFKTVTREFPNINSHFVSSDQSGPFSGLEAHIKEEDEPLGPYHHITTALSLKASTLGIRTLLTGIGGDMLPSNNGRSSFFRQLFSTGPLSSIESLKNTAKKSKSLKGFMGQEIVIPFFPEWISSKLKANNSIRNTIESSVLRSDFLTIHGIDKQLSDPTLFANRIFRDPLALAVNALNTGFTTSISNQWGRPIQMETLHPLEDFKLIEFCLGLPMEYYAYGSQKRGLFREAMRGLLPETVRTRSSKGAFIPHFHRCIRNEEALVNRLIEKIGKKHPIRDVVEFTIFEERLRTTMSDSRDYQMHRWNLTPQTDVFPTIAYALFISNKI